MSRLPTTPDTSARFHGKVILIAGGGGSLGAATARRLANEGARLVVGGLSLERLEQTRGDLLAFGAECATHVFDVRDQDGWRAFVDVARRRFGGPHGMANFTAVLSREGLESTPNEDWQQIVDVNLTGAWYGLRATVPALRKAGGVAIVNVGSIDALVGLAASTAYAASKGGVRALSKSAAIQYAPERIRVNSVHPAPMETRLTHVFGENSSAADVNELLESLRAKIPLGRLGAAEDVAAAVAFLLSDDADFITGVDLPVDGGYSAQ